jgi:membrane fusion protein (multidrug efflux system)
MVKSKLFITSSIILTLLCFILLIFLIQHKKTTIDNSSPIFVKALQVTTVNEPEIIKSIGSLVANKSVEISSEIEGRIAHIFISDGQKVQQGAVLIQLDDAVAKTQVESAKADLDLSENQYQRANKLMKVAAISKADFDQVQATLENKRVAYNKAKLNLEKTLLKAPFSGVVSESLISEGQYIKAGQLLTNLIDKDSLKVKYSLPSDYLTQLHLGQPVILSTQAIPNHSFKGFVSYISPDVDPNTRTIQLKATIPNNDNQLLPGLFVTINQIAGIKKQIVLIPQRCVIPGLNETKVYIVQNHRAIERQIFLGNYTFNQVEVVKGLNSHEVVICNGQQKVKNGDRITISELK